MKYLILYLISFNIYGATKFSDCGLYDIYGEIKKNDKTSSYDFLVNPGSMSQYVFQLTSLQERQFVPYLGHSIKVRARIQSLAPDYRGTLFSVLKINFSLPDPANFQGSGGFTLVQKESCK
jgi:hypothetical protein